MVMNGFLTLMLALILWAGPFTAFAQLEHLEPKTWWVGMHDPQLQLMAHGKNIADYDVKVSHPGVSLKQIHRGDNPNYLFVDLHIDSGAKPGEMQLEFKRKGKIVFTHAYVLLPRNSGSSQRQGFSPADVIYLITPDRFANGNPDNDSVASLTEGPNRSDPTGRHGGDVQGIIDHLDYLADLGVTQLWLNPVLENNALKVSYHGYSITNHYQVDPRFGSNALYLALSEAANDRGLGLILDSVPNHIGSQHWWMRDLPMADWINQGGEFVSTNHRREVVQDPHVAAKDRAKFHDGWFVPSMPDLNQKNPYLATYLIQHNIWWVEFAGLSGLRIDTYPYADPQFMSELTRRLLEEYPNLNIVGEEWSMNPAIVSYWQRGKINSDNYRSYLPSLMDFPLYQAVTDSLTEEESWSNGVTKIYQMIANDFLYADPYNLVIFSDNHDMSRVFTQLNERLDLFKMSMSYLLTTRGIPKIFYGTEILMKNPGTEEDGVIRSDFPGGWPGDRVNAFNGKGLTAEQKDAQGFLKKLLNWRKTSQAIHHGKLTHFVPEEGVYTYFRHTSKDKVMVMLNNSTEKKKINTGRFSELINKEKTALDVISGKIISVEKTVVIPAKSALILELR